MKDITGILVSIAILALSCKQNSIQHQQVRKKFLVQNNEAVLQENRINASGNKIETRFNPPQGYKRIGADSKSFAYYLRNLPLKPVGFEVKIYDGRIKPARRVYDAVVDLDIGKKNLHQCADAVIRLRAEYLYAQKDFDKIHFNFTNGFRIDYSEWMKGKRVVVDGNRTYWKLSAEPSNTYKSFWRYLELVFTYAGTLSLSRELQPVSIQDIKIGDVFIQGGSPGHAVIVVDLVVNSTTGDKLFLLAQSYMPAQEIQVLKNPNDSKLSPWYSANINGDLVTPEWTFERTDLKRFAK